MRILVALNPERSFFTYLAPMAWALRTAGHEVRVASSPRLAPTIALAGLTAVPVGRDSDPWRVVRDTSEELRRGVPEPYDTFDRTVDATWRYLRDGMADAVRGWHRLTNFPMIAGMVDLARTWRPDLVLWEPLCYAGAIAARAAGAVHGRLLWGVDVFGSVREQFLRRRSAQPEPERVDPLGDWLASYARKYGFEAGEDLAVGDFTIEQLPASLRISTSLERLAMQYVPYGGPAVVPAWLQRPADRPRVALTLGISATESFSGYNVRLADIVQQVARLDVEVVATVATAHQHLLGDLPSNVRVTPFVPWHVLVPTCDVVIHHAGAATLATTARHPVPQLALHFHFDQPFLGRRLAAQGAGLEFDATEATGRGVRDAVQRLLEEPAFGERAAALAAETRALPTPNRVVGHLEDLVARRSAGTSIGAGRT